MHPTPTRMFVIHGGAPCALAELLASNADDTDVCDWARSAQPGDIFPCNGSCVCIDADLEDRALFLRDRVRTGMQPRIGNFWPEMQPLQRVEVA